MDGRRRLWQAVIVQAFYDATCTKLVMAGGQVAPTASTPFEQAAARAWLFSRAGDDVCSLAAVDGRWMRATASKLARIDWSDESVAAWRSVGRRALDRDASYAG